MINTTDHIIQTLRQVVHNDPALQARLFGLIDDNDFIAAVQCLAQSLNHTATQEDIQQACRSGRKAWIERTLP
ncbi:MAG: hypothetical protein ACU83U_13960 [Gammaproteobacteria bacterium]